MTVRLPFISILLLVIGVFCTSAHAQVNTEGMLRLQWLLEDLGGNPVNQRLDFRFTTYGLK